MMFAQPVILRRLGREGKMDIETLKRDGEQSENLEMLLELRDW